MANPEKGEVALDVGGVTYTLVMDVNAMCELETLLSTTYRRVTFENVLRMVQQNSVVALRALLWASLRAHHEKVTLKGAGDLLEQAGGIEGFAKKYAELVFAAAPADSDVKALGVEKRPRPQKAQGKKTKATTGTSSVAKPV